MKIVPVPNYYFEHPDYYDDDRTIKSIWEEEGEDLTEEDEDDSQE
jgi:hypothetical protein